MWLISSLRAGIASPSFERRRVPTHATDERSPSPDQVIHFGRTRSTSAGFDDPLPPDRVIHFPRIPRSTSPGFLTSTGSCITRRRSASGGDSYRLKEKLKSGVVKPTTAGA